MLVLLAICMFFEHLHNPYVYIYIYIRMLQSEATLKFVWFTIKTVKPVIPTLSAIKHFKLPVDLQPQKVYIL